MVKDVTPLLDQEVIREDIAQEKIRSKIDLADAYKQVWIESKNIYKTLFATIMGMYYSKVVQQGDPLIYIVSSQLITSITHYLAHALLLYLPPLILHVTLLIFLQD